MPTILGIDEVGRGPWAGPLVVGAVVLGENFSSGIDIASRPENTQNPTKSTVAQNSHKPADTQNPTKSKELDEKSFLWQNLADSKQLSAKKREKLSPLIKQYAAAYGLGWVSSAEIDRYGLGPALKLAARRAVKQVLRTKIPFTEIIIDGTINLLDKTPLADRVTLLKKADSLVKEVSAASIIAKVARDQYMVDLATAYPGYGFEKHVGYGTAAHRQALENFGPCPEHRRSFRPVHEIAMRFPENSEQPKTRFPENSAEPKSPETKPNSPSKKLGRNNSALGHRAETVVAEMLTQRGHTILQQNFKTRLCEIDLVSLQSDEIIFTEVKYHQNLEHGSPLEQINARKKAQLRRAAEIFLNFHPAYAKYQPRLAAASVVGPDYRIGEYLMLTD